MTNDQPLVWLKLYPQVRYLAVTDGSKPARLCRRCPWEGGREKGRAGRGEEGREEGLLTYEYTLPRLPPDRVVNPIGAGDACGGVVLSAALQSRRRNEGGEVVSKEEDMRVVAALRLGLAAASASCLTEETGVFARGRASALERMITLKVHVTQ